MTTTPQPLFAKPLQVVAAVLIVALGTAILWRSYRLAADVDALRAALAAPPPIGSTDVGSADQMTRVIPYLQQELTAVKTYVAGLERQQQRTDELLNQTINELYRLHAATEKTTRRPWGAEQLLGEPDTMTAGNHPTAWAPAEQNAGLEWIQLGYERAVEIARVRVRETNHPGAVIQVAAVLDDGREITLWQGVEEPGVAPHDSSFEAPRGIIAKTIRVYLDTSRNPGREEIDAVELVGADGSRQWAVSASASSTFTVTR
ncbi:MAG: hypothetical protein FJ395_07005 [Verrucomicrobia bacterium]|nr:hypothetical protein [Verrucomicrobiota bacterium]